MIDLASTIILQFAAGFALGYWLRLPALVVLPIAIVVVAVLSGSIAMAILGVILVQVGYAAAGLLHMFFETGRIAPGANLSMWGKYIYRRR